MREREYGSDVTDQVHGTLQAHDDEDEFGFGDDFDASRDAKGGSGTTGGGGGGGGTKKVMNKPYDEAMELDESEDIDESMDTGLSFLSLCIPTSNCNLLSLLMLSTCVSHPPPMYIY